VAAGGEAEVSIVNDTPYELTILVGMPNSASITIEACPACKVYSMVGPIFCPQEGRPKKTVRLKPGTCKVVAKVSDPSVIPFLGVTPVTLFLHLVQVAVIQTARTSIWGLGHHKETWSSHGACWRQS